MSKLGKALFNFSVLLDGNAWALLLFGALLFGINVPMPTGGAVNLPVLVTLLQMAGGVFVVCAFTIVASRIFWPMSLTKLLDSVDKGSMPAAMVVLGLLLFNGLAVLGFCVWLALTFNGGGH